VRYHQVVQDGSKCKTVWRTERQGDLIGTSVIWAFPAFFVGKDAVFAPLRNRARELAFLVSSKVTHHGNR